MNQKNLTGRQAHWMDKISKFDFKVIYVPGAENVLADLLSRIYSDDAPETVCSEAKFTRHDDSHVYLSIHNISVPVLMGAEAVAERHRQP
ncbi:hypothetical protein L208DRAFT_1507580 [Tricholoma matsutake]|nr:hypothetical protein L208DRAFT_1507580 [Tricholoma matsutake 945]